MKEAMRRNSISSCFSSLCGWEGKDGVWLVRDCAAHRKPQQPFISHNKGRTHLPAPLHCTAPGRQRELVEVVVGGDGIAECAKVLLLDQQLVHRLVHLRGLEESGGRGSNDLVTFDSIGLGSHPPTQPLLTARRLFFCTASR